MKQQLIFTEGTTGFAGHITRIVAVEFEIFLLPGCRILVALSKALKKWKDSGKSKSLAIHCKYFNIGDLLSLGEKDAKSLTPFLLEEGIRGYSKTFECDIRGDLLSYNENLIDFA